MALLSYVETSVSTLITPRATCSVKLKMLSLRNIFLHISALPTGERLTVKALKYFCINQDYLCQKCMH